MKWYWTACDRYREGLSLLASRSLPEREAAAIEAHVAACTACRERLKEFKAAAAPFANWEEALAGIEPSESARARWSQALNAVGALRRRERGAPARAVHGVRAAFGKAWFELVWPARRTWAGLATVWIALVLFHFTQSPGRNTTVAQSKIPVTESRLAYREQQRVLGEILGAPPVGVPAASVEPSRRHRDPPRSQRERKMLYA